MTDLDLSDLLGGKSEDPSVEYKAWMDTSTNEAKAKLAKHIAALANHGGGYLVFGVEDSTREPLGETTFDRANFSQRRLAEIDTELNTLLASRLYELFIAAKLARASGRDLLQEMSDKLDAQIRAAKERLGQLQAS